MAKNIGLQKSTYDDLDERRSPGQSFDGIVQELLNKTQEQTAEATTA